MRSHFKLASLAVLVSATANMPSSTFGNSAPRASVAAGDLDVGRSARPIPFSAGRLRPGDPIASLHGAHGLTFEGGATIRSHVSTPYELRSFFGDYWAGILRDGRWLVLRRSQRDPNRVDSIDVAPTREIAGLPELRVPAPAPHRPRISGYDYVAAFPIRGTPHDYLGLWREARPGRSRQSLLVLFEGAATADSRCEVLARSSLDLSLIWVSPSLHGELWEIVLVSKASPGRPIHFLRYLWAPGGTRHSATARCA